MSLPSTGQITMSAIQGEFDGGVNPIALTEYYRGGPYVDAGTATGTGACAPISTSGQIQMCMFRGTQDTIIGNTGLITAPFGNNEYRDYTLPATARYIRFFLLGAGGGGGGRDSRRGGDAGGGSFVASTIDTSFAGSVSVDRILRVWVGRGGGGGRSATRGDSNGAPAPWTGNTESMIPKSNGGTWSTFANTYGVSCSYRYDGADDYVNTHTLARTIYFPVTGTYTFYLQCDNTGYITVDGTTVIDTSGFNNTSYSGTNSFALASPLVRSATVTAGLHKVAFVYNNSGGPACVAARILKPDTSELFNTRQAQGQFGWPVGGMGGYSGSGGGNTSGYGGAGGSGTFFSIIHPVNGESRVACAGGGGGGGGGGGNHWGANSSYNGNYKTQGISLTITNPNFVSGQEGEYPDGPNQGRGWPVPGNADGFFSSNDGGGGGGGGGGIANNRIYASGIWNSDVELYSGIGGKLRLPDGTNGTGDDDADGGECGKSWINGNAPRFGDFVFSVTTSTTPRLSANLPVSFAGYGTGGAAALTSPVTNAVAGTDGCAYIDWGVTNSSAAPTSISYPGLVASTWPVGVSLTTSYPDTTVYQVVDAWGGGGRPGEDYTYSWSYNGGTGVTFSSPNSYRTNIQIPGVNASTPYINGSVRCTVTDSVGNSAVAYVSWSLTYYDPNANSGGGG